MLHLTVKSYINISFFFQTISDTVNDLLKLEEKWENNGYNVTEVPPFISAKSVRKVGDDSLPD